MTIPVYAKFESAFGGPLFDARIDNVNITADTTIDDETHTGRLLTDTSASGITLTFPSTLPDGFYCYVRPVTGPTTLSPDSLSLTGSGTVRSGQLGLIVKGAFGLISFQLEANASRAVGEFPPVTFSIVSADQAPTTNDSGTVYVFTGATTRTLTLPAGASSSVGDYFLATNSLDGTQVVLVEPTSGDNIAGFLGADLLVTGETAAYVYRGNNTWQKIFDAQDETVPPWLESSQSPINASGGTALSISSALWNSDVRNTVILGDGQTQLPPLDSGVAIGEGVRFIATDTDGMSVIPRTARGDTIASLASVPITQGNELIIYREDNTFDWKIFYQGPSRGLPLGAGQSLTPGVNAWGNLQGSISDDEILRVLNRLGFRPSSGEQYTLPEPLQAFAQDAEVVRLANTAFETVNVDLPVRATYAVLKNSPPRGTTVPIVAGDFVNEITNSLVTLTPPADLTSVLIPREVNGTFIDGVSSATGGVLTGPGIDEDSFIINQEDSENPNVILGFWMYIRRAVTVDEPLVEVKLNGSASFRSLIVMTANGLRFVQSNEDGVDGTRSSTRSAMGVDGAIEYSLDGTVGQEESFRIFNARTFTVTARLIASGSVEDTQTFTVVISDVNTPIAETTQNVVFATSQGNVAQDIIYSYDPSASLYGSNEHALRLRIDTLATQAGLTIESVDVGVSYNQTEPVSGPTTTFSNAEFSTGLGDAGDIALGRLHKMIISLRMTPADDLEAIMTLDGESENNISFLYPAADLDYSQIRINGGGEFVVQNIQGGVLPFDLTPLRFPRHADIRDWTLHHDVKATDYVWDNVAAPAEDVETVRIPEFTNLENLQLVSPNNTRYLVRVTDAGALETVADTR